MIRAENIVAGYGKRVVVAVDSLEIAPGKLTVLIGPNASGKSTLARCLAQALKPQQGRVLLDDRDLYRVSARDAARAIAYVPQNNPAPFAFTVAELVGLGAQASGSGLSATRQKASVALQLLELSHLAGRNLTTLSGGEQQRAASARAFAQDTAHLLLDEPTAHLDLRHQTVLLRAAWAAAHEENKAVVVVLHDLNLAAQWGDYFVLMHQGRVLAQGSAGDVLTEPILSIAYETMIHVKHDLTVRRPHIWPVHSAPPTA